MREKTKEDYKKHLKDDDEPRNIVHDLYEQEKIARKKIEKENKRLEATVVGMFASLILGAMTNMLAVCTYDAISFPLFGAISIWIISYIISLEVIFFNTLKKGDSKGRILSKKLLSLLMAIPCAGLVTFLIMCSWGLFKVVMRYPGWTALVMVGILSIAGFIWINVKIAVHRVGKQEEKGTVEK